MNNLETYINSHIANYTLNADTEITFKVWSKAKDKYNKTSINNLPLFSPRVKNFIAHHGLTHYVRNVEINGHKVILGIEVI